MGTHEKVPERTTRTAAVRPTSRPQLVTEQDRVLSLQRDAGNRAVTEHLQRQAPAAPATQRKTDAEGNPISVSGVRPYLTGLAGPVRFPAAGPILPQALPPNPHAAFAMLRGRCAAVAATQLALANAMRGDMKYWFARVYYFVTVNELKMIDSGRYQYPIMKMQEILAFHATYEENLKTWRAGNIDKVESNWRSAFTAAEWENGGTWWKARSHEILDSLLPSMEAHIRFDLPRAIASVFERNYAGVPGVGLSLFQADFHAMGPVFDAATAAVRPEIEADCYLMDPGNVDTLADAGFPFFFNIPVEREQTWEKAEALVSGHESGIIGAQMQQRLEAYMTGAHPFSGDDAFDVDSTTITDYDWEGQPR